MSRNKQTKQNISLIQALRGEEDFQVEEEILILKDTPSSSSSSSNTSNNNNNDNNNEDITTTATNRATRTNPNILRKNNNKERKEGKDNDEDEDDEDEEEKSNNQNNNNNNSDDYELDDDFDVTKLSSIEDMRERAKYIPLRLTYEERKSLRLVNAAINVSDYTNSVDIEFKSKSKRRHTQLQNICGFLSGVISASSYEEGQKVLQDRNFCDYETFLQNTLEISRRYKVMNPEKMRSEYGKLVFLIQDAVSPEIKSLLGVDIHKPIRTVYDLLESKGGLAVLDDPRLHTASQEIYPDKNKSRHELDSEIKRKEKAAKLIIKDHETHRLTAEDIRQCLYSICDNNSFLNSNCRPIENCIQLLQKYFSPTKIAPGYSLAIEEGSGGSRLNHSHELQYHYVLQSLTLWSAIVRDMFRLWYLSECDLLDCEQQPYELKNTGQGLQRLQQSPRVYRAMHEILQHTQYKLGNWVGSSVIHLGDTNVPNTLTFIDKYTQVSRILGPLISTLDNLEAACRDNEGLGRYMNSYGGIDKAKKDILHDFFTHAFDGSGGENYFEAGSCIDGRLTSAWNWCSQLSYKPYYVLFRLTGFLSFDGEFDK